MFPTVSEILALSDPTWDDATTAAAPSMARAQEMARQQRRAEREWQGAIAALSELLSRHATTASAPQGLILSGPLPVLSDPDLREAFAAWTLTLNSFDTHNWQAFRLLPASDSLTPLVCELDETTAESIPVLPLLPGDPLAGEQFCLVLTPWFSLVMALGTDLSGTPTLLVSFLPEVVERIWKVLRSRILITSSHQLTELDDLVARFAPVPPSYALVMQFHQKLLANLPEPLELRQAVRSVESFAREVVTQQQGNHHNGHAAPSLDFASLTDGLPDPMAMDVELLQAIAHEVRTPLTTIRTLTRSLLRRTDLPDKVVQRLESIDRECSEQIDRFSLLFRAAELETTCANAPTCLTRTSVADVLHQSVPRWEKQAQQRGLNLEVALPHTMPAVVSDPSLLDQALTSLIERFTRNLPADSHIRVDVTLAGSQLKLQLQAALDETATDGDPGRPSPRSALKSLGQMLMFQPETGSLSLNLSATKNLFQALGGKLIARERPSQGEVLTVYLPVEPSDPRVLEV